MKTKNGVPTTQVLWSKISLADFMISFWKQEI